MSHQRDTDPEVLADLRHREASERDRSRSALVCCDGCKHHVRDHDSNVGPCSECDCQEFERSGGPRWSPPVIVERWPCTGCNALVEMTSEALETHAQLSSQLERMGERPLARRIPCTSCKAREDELARARRRPHEQSQLREVAPAEERPSWMPTPRAERRRTR